MTNAKQTRGLNRSGDIVKDSGAPWSDLLEGTENFVLVTTLGGGGWDWSEFRCWYDTEARVYFWSDQSGCSCNSFEVWSVGDLANGDRGAAMKAARSSGNNYCITDIDAQEGAARIRNFDPRKVAASDAA